jgi:hypothetical protein
MESLVKLLCTLAQFAVTFYAVMIVLTFVMAGAFSGPLSWMIGCGLTYVAYKVASAIVQGLDRVKEKLS